MGDELHAELARLRTGAGLRAARLGDRVGPRLRAACGVAPADGEAVIRAKVSECIRRWCSRLAPDDAGAVLLALNLDPDYSSRFFQARMDHLGQQIDRERRTAVRRVDDALQLLVERIEASASPSTTSRFAPGGWFFDALRSRLVLDDHRLELTENRVVTATVDGLDRITVGWSTERTPEYDSAFTVELLGGGELVPDPARIGDGAWAGEVVLPRPLAAGESHEYTTRVSQAGTMEPYYIVTPFRRTDLFAMTVVFRSVPHPVRAWRVAGEPARFVDDPTPAREPFEIDPSGELSATFEQLDIGLSYGLRWALSGG